MAGILYAEINVFAILIIGMIFWKLMAMKNKPQEYRLFALLLVGAVIFFCMDGMWALIEAGYIRAGYTVSYLINLIYFIIAGILPFAWLVYTVRTGANSRFGKRWMNVILAVPLLVFLCLLLTNYWGNWIFYIDEAGKYNRGKLFFLQPLCSYGYFTIPAVRTVIAFCKDGFKNKKVNQSIISFVFVPLIFGILQFVFDGSPWLCIGITIAVLQLYLYTLAVDEMNHERQYQELLKKKNADLQDALLRAEAANKSKSTFLNSMSHDIRTPMNAILGFARIAKENAGDEEKVEDCLEKVLSSGDYLLHLINEVLDMARIESGKVSIDEKPVSLRETVTYLESLFQISMKQKNLDFEVEMNLQEEYVYVDELRLNQICMNLLSNAQKYTHAGGHVWFTCTQLGEKTGDKADYLFSVRDTGMGMSKSFQENLFGAFEREKRAEIGQIQGSGLGLAITKHIVDLMGGRIEVESEQGKGTEMRVYLSLQLDEEARVKNTRRELSKMDFTGKRILLAEDNELNSEIAHTLLGEVGFVVEVAPDGAEAVQMLLSSEPGYFDLVLMDIQMPNMNGYQATTAIRSCGKKEYENIPIVAMTANAFEEDRRKAFDCGMNEHIAKPVDVEKLISVLKEIL